MSRNPWRNPRKIDGKPSFSSQKSKKENKNRLIQLNQLDRAIAQGTDFCPFRFKRGGFRSDRRYLSHPRKKKAKQMLRSRKVGFCKANVRRNIRRYDCIPDAFPNMGRAAPELAMVRKLSPPLLRQRRRHLLRLTCQIKKDYEKSRALQWLLVGTLVRTSYVGVISVPYVTPHPDGWIYIGYQPSLRSAQELLSMCLNCYSTLLGKVALIDSVFKSIDSHRELSRILSCLRAIIGHSLNDHLRMEETAPVVSSLSRVDREPD
jgi:hypothetical protein